MAFCLKQYGKEGMNIETAAVEAKGDFSDPAVLADTRKLMLPPADIKDLMKCKPGACKMKVPETAFKKIAQLKQAGDNLGSTANVMFQEAVVEYVNAYLIFVNRARLDVMRRLPGFLKRVVYNGARNLFHEKMTIVKRNLEAAYTKKVRQ